MIEIAFNESAACALKMAKSTRQCDILKCAVVVFGGTDEERRAVMEPRIWQGIPMEGSSRDVQALSLALGSGGNGRPSLFRHCETKQPKCCLRSQIILQALPDQSGRIKKGVSYGTSKNRSQYALKKGIPL